MEVAVIIEPWRAHPLAWIHRGEGRAIARELGQANRPVTVLPFRADRAAELPPGSLLRLSDPAMFAAAQALGRAGIRATSVRALQSARCMTNGWRTASRTPPAWTVPTALAPDAGFRLPLVVKPRCGSDSLGMRLVRAAHSAKRARARASSQERIVGAELTVGVIHDCVGMPLRIDLP
jgi:hypothetical protein